MAVTELSYGLDSLPNDGLSRAVSIGKFDGVHRGHKKVIEQLVSVSRGAEVTVVTFDRHPYATLLPEKEPSRILSVDQKVELLGEAGVERVVILPFDAKLSRLSHKDFSRSVLGEGLSARAVLVGSDFRYGRGGRGTIDSLRAQGEAFGFRVEEVADVCEADGVRISSTLIRSCLEKGRVREVSALLSRYHSIRGVVGHGFERGRILGYPTANISEDIEGFLPADGVYATLFSHGGRTYQSATSIGVNPTFGDLDQRVLESHLFDFDGDLYGRAGTIEFVEFIRGMQKFDSPEELSKQMARDGTRIRQILDSSAAS